MSSSQITWSQEDESRLLELYKLNCEKHNKWQVISEEMGRTEPSVRHYWDYHKENIIGRLQESPYPCYNEPLQMEGDAVIIPDLELPFHNAEFVNKVLDIAQAWNIRQCVLAGDTLHFDSLSTLGKKWKKSNHKGGLDDEQERKLTNFLMGLGSRQQEKGFKLLEEIGRVEEDDGLSTELKVARRAIEVLKQCFDNVDMLLGNHEGRLLRALDTPIIPDEVIRLIEAGDWRIAPYYFSYVISNGEKFRIDHPRTTAKGAAEQLAAKYGCHVIMAHSHRLSWSWDISGRYYAIQIGHCVDENRLPYAAQRSNLATHLLGACIIRNGIPWILHQKSDFKKLMNLK
jgi:hypothetical protein